MDMASVSRKKKELAERRKGKCGKGHFEPGFNDNKYKYGGSAWILL
jgi:hypothetical protein